MATTRRRPKGSGSIRKLKNGKYLAQYTAPPGSIPPKPAKSFDRQSDAVTWLARELQAVREGRHVSRVNLTLGEWLTEFVDTYRSQNQPATQDEYTYSIKRLEKHCPGLLRVPLAEVTVPALQQAVNALQATYHSRTVEITYKLLRQALRKAALLHTAPLMELGEVDIKQDPAKRGGRYIPKQKLDHLRTVCMAADPLRPHNVYFAVLLVMMQTGARNQEILGMECSQLNARLQTVKIAHALNCRGELAPTKTRRSVRTIPLVQLSWTICAHYAARSIRGLVFESRTGRPLNYRNTLRAMSRVLPGYTPHDLRHTYMTNAIRKGVLPTDLSRLTGDSVEQIMRTYVHPDEEHLMRTARLIASDKVIPIRAMPADKQIISKSRRKLRSARKNKKPADGLSAG
jgi:integrase